MDYDNAYEREIDLKELMFAVLHRWKLILAVTIVFALILGGYKAVSGYRSQSNNPEAEEAYAKAVEEYNESLEICNREIDNLTSDIENQQKYVEESVLMNISPYDVWTAKAELFVNPDYEEGEEYRNAALTATIMRAYQSGLTSGELLDRIAADTGVEQRYLQELIKVSVRLDDFSGIQSWGTGLTFSSRQDNLLTIEVRHKTEQDASELMDEILKGVKQFQAQISSGIGRHSVTEFTSSVSSQIDLSLAERQTAESERLTTLKASLDAKNEELKGMKMPEPASSSFIKAGVKYGVVGGVLGAFMVVFFVCIGFVMSDKVYSAKELKYRFNVKILGRLPLSCDKSVGRIDMWLNRLEGRAWQADTEHEYGLISANICNYTEGAESLLVIGNAQEERLAQAVTELTAKLPGIKVVLGGNLLKDVEGLKKLPECDGVILVEECKTSLYSDVELEIEKARDLQKMVVGCIVFE